MPQSAPLQRRTSIQLMTKVRATGRRSESPPSKILMQTFQVIWDYLPLPHNLQKTHDQQAEATICSQERKSSSLDTYWRIVKWSYRQKQFDNRWNQLTPLPPASKPPCLPCLPCQPAPVCTLQVMHCHEASSPSLPKTQLALALRKTPSLAQEFTPFEAKRDICTSNLFCWALCYHWQALLCWLTSLHILWCCVLLFFFLKKKKNLQVCFDISIKSKTLENTVLTLAFGHSLRCNTKELCSQIR